MKGPRGVWDVDSSYSPPIALLPVFAKAEFTSQDGVTGALHACKDSTLEVWVEKTNNSLCFLRLQNVISSLREMLLYLALHCMKVDLLGKVQKRVLYISSIHIIDTPDSKDTSLDDTHLQALIWRAKRFHDGFPRG